MPYRLAYLVVMTLAILAPCALSPGQDYSAIRQILDGIRAESFKTPSIVGNLRIETSYVNQAPLDASTTVLKSQRPAGDYKFWVTPRGWWVKKKLVEDPRSGTAIARIHIKRSYEDKVLDYELFELENGSLVTGYGKLFEKDPNHIVCPLVGRGTGQGSIFKLLAALESPVVSPLSGSLVLVKGLYGRDLNPKVTWKQDVSFVFDVSQGFLAKKYTMSKNDWRAGFEVLETKRFGSSWFVTKATFESGTYVGNELVKGTRHLFTFTDIHPSIGPSAADLPSLAPGSIVGGDTVLYRVAADGSLRYWGQAGRAKPQASIAWGPVFVLSGAALLLGSLSWLILRKR